MSRLKKKKVTTIEDVVDSDRHRQVRSPLPASGPILSLADPVPSGAGRDERLATPAATPP